MQRQIIRCEKGHLGLIEAGATRKCPKCGAEHSPVIKDDEGHSAMPLKQAERLMRRLEDEARKAKRQAEAPQEA